MHVRLGSLNVLLLQYMYSCNTEIISRKSGLNILRSKYWYLDCRYRSASTRTGPAVLQTTIKDPKAPKLLSTKNLVLVRHSFPVLPS